MSPFSPIVLFSFPRHRSASHDPLQQCPRLLSRPSSDPLAGRERRRANGAARHGSRFPAGFLRLAYRHGHLLPWRGQRSVPLLSAHASAHARAASEKKALGRTDGTHRRLCDVLGLRLRLSFRSRGRTPVLERILQPLQLHRRGLSHLYHGSDEKHRGILSRHSPACRRCRKCGHRFPARAAPVLEARRPARSALPASSGRVLRHDLRGLSLLAPRPAGQSDARAFRQRRLVAFFRLQKQRARLPGILPRHRRFARGGPAQGKPHGRGNALRFRRRR